jgi:hypothetical protein
LSRQWRRTIAAAPPFGKPAVSGAAGARNGGKEAFTLSPQNGRMRAILLLLACLLTACGATPEQLASGLVGFGIGTIAVIQRSPFDAVYSTITGRDCSIVRLDRGQSYCRPVEPAPPPPPFCTRSLGTVDCWQDPVRLPGQPQPVAQGPQTLTPEQEAHRLRTWPF